MKKYLFIFKSQVMTNLQYVSNVFIGFIGYVIMIFIFLNLWRYIYSNPNEVINGYTMNQMIWYVIITEILWSVLDGRKYSKKISRDVKDGNITYNINKPYSYIGYCLSHHLGDNVIKGIIYTVLAMILGFIFLGSFPDLNILSILAIILTGILATVISTLIITFLSLFAFFIEDAGPLYWVYSKFILVLGTIFPIEYFPKFVQPILKYSPIYAVSYGPARLFVNFNWIDFVNILLFQIIYVLVAYLLCDWIYNKGVKRLNVNGG